MFPVVPLPGGVIEYASDLAAYRLDNAFWAYGDLIAFAVAFAAMLGVFLGWRLRSWHDRVAIARMRALVAQSPEVPPC